MMKPIGKILSLVLFAFALCACTHNNGDIGPLYGQWKLESIEVDGEPQAAYAGNMFWSFQNDILAMNEVDADELISVMHFATWRRSGDELIIDFRHYDSASSEGSIAYSPPAVLGLQPKAVNALTIVKLTSGKLELKYDAGDKLIAYRLKKWG